MASGPRCRARSGDPFESSDWQALTTDPLRSTTLAFVTISSRQMSESTLSRIGAAAGATSVVVTFIGFGVHRGLPADTTAGAVGTYVNGVSASQAGIGNYLELLGYLVFLAFAVYLYAVARAGAADSLHWLNVLGLAAAITYIAVSASAIAGQLLMVEWAKAGADLKTVLGAYILDTAAFTLSFEIAALFMLAVGIVLWTRGGALRVIGGSGILVGVILFVTGFVGTASIQSPSSQIGFMAFSLWTLIAGIYLVIRPARIARAS